MKQYTVQNQSLLSQEKKLKELLVEFKKHYVTEVKQTYSKELRSYKILVNEVPAILNKFITKDHMITKGSIGAGVNTYFPWFSIHDQRVSTGASNGFYIVFLFSNDFEDLYLTLNQAVSNANEKSLEENTKEITTICSSIEGFKQEVLPSDSLVKVPGLGAINRGLNYQRSNIFYRKYVIDKVNENDLVNHLLLLLDKYDFIVEEYLNQTNNHNETTENNDVSKTYFSISSFQAALESSNLKFKNDIVSRFVSSLLAKRFLILTGLSGSGKTKLAQAFVEWISDKAANFKIVPVGSDWTNREPLLGFPNALEPGKYVKPESGVLDLIFEAKNNSNLPYFLILDEMNLSHVERYFSDFLSAMESDDYIYLHPNSPEWTNEEDELALNVPDKLKLPTNLFIIGTVNVDETTYMFSPKVLDRANVIEFRVDSDDINSFLENPVRININELRNKGASMANSFVALAKDESNDFAGKEVLNKVLIKIFIELEKLGAEFGFRTAVEISNFCSKLQKILGETGEAEIDKIIDFAILQKILPKLHGSRKKLEPVLDSLAKILYSSQAEALPEIEAIAQQIESAKYKESLRKTLRMRERVIQDGFTSFAEA